MTISGGGLNINYNPTPSIYEQQTTGQQELQKQADIGKGNVVIASQTDLIPMSKMAERNTWNYKSEAGRPSLLPMGTLRGSSPDSTVRDEGWLTRYGELFDELPEDIKAELLGLSTINTEAMKLILELAARAINWQDQAAKMVNNESALIRTQINLDFDRGLLANSKDMGEEFLKNAENWLETLGRNDPQYLESKEFINTLKEFLKEVRA